MRDDVVLWFEHDLFDQLQLLDILTFVRELGSKVEAIVIDSFPGRVAFRGLGELTPTELASLSPSRREVSPAQLAAAAAAW